MALEAEPRPNSDAGGSAKGASGGCCPVAPAIDVSAGLPQLGSATQSTFPYLSLPSPGGLG